MGLRDTMSRMAEEQTERRQAGAEAARAVVLACPDPSEHYVTEVNKSSIRMSSWQSNLNSMYRRGYRLAHVFEQDGNTIQVYEHHSH